MTAEACVSVEEVANHLGLARDSIYRWIEATAFDDRLGLRSAKALVECELRVVTEVA